MDQSEAKEGNASENASEFLPPHKKRRKIIVLKERLNY
jgi:hypothetical protein